MPNWNAHVIVKDPATWKKTGTTARDAVANAADLGPATPNLTALWDAAQAVADQLMETIGQIPEPGEEPRQFDVDVTVGDDPMFSTVTVSVTWRTS